MKLRLFTPMVPLIFFRCKTSPELTICAWPHVSINIAAWQHFKTGESHPHTPFSLWLPELFDFLPRTLQEKQCDLE